MCIRDRLITAALTFNDFRETDFLTIFGVGRRVSTGDSVGVVEETGSVMVMLRHFWDFLFLARNLMQMQILEEYPESTDILQWLESQKFLWEELKHNTMF